MSTLPGNPHADAAISRLRNGTNTEVARAQVEATLALAHEQRTANLIAYQANVEASMMAAPRVPRTKRSIALNQQIIAALNLPAEEGTK